MASPPYGSPALALSPPNPSAGQLPNKKRSSPLDVGAPPPVKRRKPSSLSQTSSSAVPAHPLRQTSFPPEASSPYAAPRSPSFDAASSVVSGSAVSAAKKKQQQQRPTASSRKSKTTGRVGVAAGNQDATERTPSLVGGKATTTVSGVDKDPTTAAAAADDEDDEKEELALEDVVARTQEQKQEEIRLRAMLVEAFDADQYNRYEMWRAAKLSDAVVKRVVNATVSQSVPQMVSTAVKAVAKLFAGEIIEAARRVQAQWIAAGEVQSDVAAPDGYDDDDDHDHDDRRGPLRPDHLREAWRLYKTSGESHGVGMQQLWHAQRHDGVERFSTRTQKRLFK